MPESVRDFRVKLRLATAGPGLDSLSGEEQLEATSNLQQNNKGACMRVRCPLGLLLN